MLLIHSRLGQIATLPGTPEGAAVGWVHSLAFDLVVGCWAYLDSRARGIRAWLITRLVCPPGFFRNRCHTSCPPSAWRDRLLTFGGEEANEIRGDRTLGRAERIRRRRTSFRHKRRPAAETTFRGTLSSVGTLSGVTFNGDVQLVDVGAAFLYVRDGLTVNGTLRLGTADGFEDCRLYFSNTQTVGGNGGIVFGGHATGNLLQAYGAGGGVTLGPNLTIRGGRGTISTAGSNARILNQGVVTADAGGAILTLGGTWTNSNTLRLANGGGFQLSGANITGGTLAAANPATVSVVAASTLAGMTVTSDVELVDGASQYLYVRDGRTVNGTLRLGRSDGALSSRIYFSNTQTVGGNGSIVLGGNASNLLQAYGTGVVVTMGPNLTIRGSRGTINTAEANARIINQGTIIADVNGNTTGGALGAGADTGAAAAAGVGPASSRGSSAAAWICRCKPACLSTRRMVASLTARRRAISPLLSPSSNQRATKAHWLRSSAAGLPGDVLACKSALPSRR